MSKCRQSFAVTKELISTDDCIFLLIVMLSGADTSSSYWEETYTQPYFDNTTRRDLTGEIKFYMLYIQNESSFGW